MEYNYMILNKHNYTKLLVLVLFLFIGVSMYNKSRAATDIIWGVKAGESYDYRVRKTDTTTNSSEGAGMQFEVSSIDNDTITGNHIFDGDYIIENGVICTPYPENFNHFNPFFPIPLELDQLSIYLFLIFEIEDPDNYTLTLKTETIQIDDPDLNFLALNTGYWRIDDKNNNKSFIEIEINEYGVVTDWRNRLHPITWGFGLEESFFADIPGYSSVSIIGVSFVVGMILIYSKKKDFRINPNNL